MTPLGSKNRVKTFDSAFKFFQNHTTLPFFTDIDIDHCAKFYILLKWTDVLKTLPITYDWAFCENNYFRKTLHLRYLTRFWLRFWIGFWEDKLNPRKYLSTSFLLSHRLCANHLLLTIVVNVLSFRTQTLFKGYKLFFFTLFPTFPVL